MTDELETVKEVAKTTGKVVDGLRELGSFIARVTGATVTEAVGIVEDRVRYARWERGLRLIDRANAEMDRRGMTEVTRPVPLNVAMPLIEAGSLEEDDFLQDRYVHLLSRAADATFDIEIRRAFVSILEDMTPLDAQVLDTLYSADPPDAESGRGLRTADLPLSASAEGPEELQHPSPDVAVSLGNLARLGLVESAMMYSGMQSVYLTDLGRAFIRATSPHGEPG